jgi:hypothetical protein
VVASQVQLIGGAAVKAKNEALFLGRVPHVRQSVHGPKKIGRSPFQRYYNAGEKTAAKSKNSEA